MSKKVVLSIVMVVMLISLSGGCKKSDYQLQILFDKQPYRSFTLKEIKSMPAESFVMDGKIESGPSLASLLAFSGIQTYFKIEVMNEAYELIEFSAEQDLKTIILDITNRGNVKIASKNIAKKDWMKDITTIAVTSHP